MYNSYVYCYPELRVREKLMKFFTGPVAIVLEADMSGTSQFCSSHTTRVYAETRFGGTKSIVPIGRLAGDPHRRSMRYPQCFARIVRDTNGDFTGLHIDEFRWHFPAPYQNCIKLNRRR